MITLRKNQVEPVRIGIDFLQQKKADPSLIIAPTAFGKSIVIAKIADALNEKLLILQPTKELLEQNYQKFVALGGFAQIYSASFNSKRIGEVTYATIGSIKNIGATFKALGFTKMIIDEAHLYPREQDSMLGKFLKDSGITHVLGLTATPLKLQTNTDRDGNNYSKLSMLTARSKKGNFYKEIIYAAQIREMVELKYWSPLEYKQHEFDEKDLRFNSTKADFTEQSMNDSYYTNDVAEKILKEISEMPDRKSILVFLPSVDEAKRLASLIPDAVAVYGDMPSKERDQAIRDFKAGRIRVVFNMNVLSVGFDHPGLDAIIMGRATASIAWYYQALGRGTRICEGKENCLIIDFSGNVKRFGRIEHFYFYKHKGYWKLFGENYVLLTGCPIHEIGKHTYHTENAPKRRFMPFGVHKGKEVKDLPIHYREWLLKNITWNEGIEWIKDEIEHLSKVRPTC